MRLSGGGGMTNGVGLKLFITNNDINNITNIQGKAGCLKN